MNLYDQLFPEDSFEGEEKIASRSMDYFGIRFDERVEKLAGIKEVGSRGWQALKDFASSGVKDIRGKGTFNVRKGKPSYLGRSGNEGKVQALKAWDKGGFSGRGLAEQAISRGRGAGKLGLLASPAIGAGYYATKGHKKKAGVGDYMKRMWAGAKGAHEGAKSSRNVYQALLKNPATRAEGLGAAARLAAPGAVMGAGGLAGGLAGGYALGRSGKKKKK